MEEEDYEIVFGSDCSFWRWYILTCANLVIGMMDFFFSFNLLFFYQKHIFLHFDRAFKIHIITSNYLLDLIWASSELYLLSLCFSIKCTYYLTLCAFSWEFCSLTIWKVSLMFQRLVKMMPYISANSNRSQGQLMHLI